VTTSAAKKKSTNAPAKKTAPVKTAKAATKVSPAAKENGTARPTPGAKSPAAKSPAAKSAVAVSAEAPAAASVAAAKKAPAAKPAAAAKSAPATPSPAPRPGAKPVAGDAPVLAAVPAKVSAPAPQLAGAPVAMPPGVVPRKPGRGTPKYFVAPVQTPLPAPTSRFADRFAPPRPPTRQMSKLESDTPRQAHKADPKLANAWKTKSGRDLSDDEVLAMPDSEYMNEKQLEFFRAKLQALKDDLLSNAGETTEHLREDTSIVPDPADRATIEEEHALELRTRDRERKLLKKISQSLGRIESGEYGFCDETGEPIGLGRLIARPTATLSLEAQQRRELKQKMFGD
jgi:DnaK suppressor protein